MLCICIKTILQTQNVCLLVPVLPVSATGTGQQEDTSRGTSRCGFESQFKYLLVLDLEQVASPLCISVYSFER